MENKKLFKYLLKDLSELEEMFTEKDRNSFDELEMEFIQNRVFGAKKLVQMYLERENLPAETKPGSITGKKQGTQQGLLQIDFSGGKTGVWVEETSIEKKPVESVKEITNMEKTPEVEIQHSTPEIISDIATPEIFVENINVETENVHSVDELDNETDEQEDVVVIKNENQEKQVIEIITYAEKTKPVNVEPALHLDEEEPADNHSKRLGDLFAKEKTVNDLMSEDFSKLEHKLSNRPVANIHSSIGINDRFQYIRELFEGSVDNFVKTVADLDSMNDIKEAVNYLQANFKWKKNETSLKFINLVKRRFPNE